MVGQQCRVDLLALSIPPAQTPTQFYGKPLDIGAQGADNEISEQTSLEGTAMAAIIRCQKCGEAMHVLPPHKCEK